MHTINQEKYKETQKDLNINLFYYMPVPCLTHEYRNMKLWRTYKSLKDVIQQSKLMQTNLCKNDKKPPTKTAFSPPKKSDLVTKTL